MAYTEFLLDNHDVVNRVMGNEHFPSDETTHDFGTPREKCTTGVYSSKGYPYNLISLLKKQREVAEAAVL